VLYYPVHLSEQDCLDDLNLENKGELIMEQVSLSERTVEVTGVERGIGRAIVRSLAQHGAMVIAAAHGKHK
jgi:hypothetical protein